MQNKLKKYIWGDPNAEDFIKKMTQRQVQMEVGQQEAVMEIIEKVRKEGDAALRALTKQYDGVDLEDLCVSEAEFQSAQRRVSEDMKRIMADAITQITRFHQEQKPKDYEVTINGATSGVRYLPLEKAGIYVPGGKANYPSSVLMNAVPALVAGVGEIVMVTPPDRAGRIADEVLVAAQMCGITKVLKIGGAQAIAALAYGTETVAKVDVITGPGNVYVSIAKKMVYGEVNIDMIAGPSEILIVSDGKQKPQWLAADLLSQAEHDEMASAILLTLSEEEADQVVMAIDAQLIALPKRAIAEQSVKRYGGVVVCRTPEEMVALANRLAPEHLELLCPEIDIKEIVNAGCVFVGPYTPEPIGDYWAGPNHVLPTNGSARAFSPLGVDHFMKRSNYTQVDLETLKRVGQSIANFARVEGLEAHARSLERRLE